MDKTNGVFSRLLTRSHGVGKCALFVAKVENVNIMEAACLFMAVLVKYGEACNVFSENSSPQGAVIVDGRIGAVAVGSQVLSFAGLRVIQWQAPPGSQVISSGLVAVGPHIGVTFISEVIAGILM